jgi:hypothetical protein
VAKVTLDPTFLAQVGATVRQHNAQSKKGRWHPFYPIHPWLI